MSVLFDLPDDLCKVFVSEWVGHKELGRLDSALCCNQWRVQFESFIRSIEDFSRSYYGLRKLQWMLKRGIAVHVLMLDEENTGAEWSLALAPVWKNLKELTICDYDDADSSEFADEINTCINLKRLCIEDDNFSITALNSQVIQNLTHLELPGFDDERSPLPTLNRIHKHCRMLKTFRYVFRPTSQAALVLFDIIQLNPDLVDVSLQVNWALLRKLTSLCSHSLTSIDLYGKVDYNTIAHVLRHFKKVESISISKVNGVDPQCFVTYIKSKQRLELRGESAALDGWKNFLASIPGVQTLKWSGNGNHHFYNDDDMWSTVQCIEIDVTFDKINKEKLAIVLSKSVALVKLVCTSMYEVNWPDVLKGNNHIEQLIISGPNPHMAYLLNACLCLKSVKFTHCDLSQDMIPSLVAAIKNYKHATTGQSIVCSCGEDFKYDGSKFSGSQWDEYQKLIKAQTKD